MNLLTNPTLYLVWLNSNLWRQHSNQIEEKLRRERTSMGRTVIYCRTQDACPQLYLWMSCCLRKHKTDPPNAPDIPKFRIFNMISMYASWYILESITSNTAPLRIVISTVAFGMGINPLAANDAKMRHLHPPQVQALSRAHQASYAVTHSL